MLLSCRIVTAACLLLLAAIGAAQPTSTEPDLSALAAGRGWTIVNRSVPGPDGWFHARIVVAWPKVSVFVNEAKEPCLVVDQLSERKRGWVGLWVDVSEGDFANLRLTPRQ